MKKLKTFLTATALILNSVGHTAPDPRNEARAAVNASHDKARQDAAALMKWDMYNSMAEVMNTAMASKSSDAASRINSFTQDMENLSKGVAALLKRYEDSQNITEKDVLEFWTSYKNAVRKRFELSFQAQQAYHDDGLFLKSAEHAIKKFKNTCEHGRADKNLNYSRKELPNLPPVHFDMRINFTVGSQSGVSGVSAQNSNSTGDDKGAQNTGNILYTTAGITSSIALSGGGGAVVATAAVAAPYLVGAAVAYAVVTSVIAQNEQTELQNQVVQANIIAFRDTASDKDVAKYYKEACQEIIPVLSDLERTFEMLQRSPEDRERVIRHAQSIENEIKVFEEETALQQQNLAYMELYSGAAANVCLLKGDATANSLCYRDTTNFVLIKDRRVTLPLDLKNAAEIAAPFTESANRYGKKYPAAKRSELVAGRIALTFGPESSAEHSLVNQFSVIPIDSVMGSAMQRVHELFTQLRAMKNAEWNKKNAELNIETSALQTFDGLKSKHKQILAEGIKVIFGHTDRTAYRKKATAYINEAMTFCRKYYQNKTVGSFYVSVKALEKIYKTL